MTTETITSPPAALDGRVPQELRQAGPRLRTRMLRVLRQVLMIAAVVVALYPILWMIVSSLRPDGHIFGNPSLVLNTFEAANYTDGWNALGAPFSTYLLNSALVVGGAPLHPGAERALREAGLL